jgi:PAS fold
VCLCWLLPPAIERALHLHAVSYGSLLRGELMNFLRYVPTPIAITDLHLCYLDVSESWCKFFAVPGQAKELLGVNHLEFLDALGLKDQHQSEEMLHQALKGTIKYSRPEGEWLNIGNKPRCVRWVVAPWNTETGQIGGLVIAGTEITNLVQGKEVIENLHSENQRLKMGFPLEKLTKVRVKLKQVMSIELNSTSQRLLTEALQELDSLMVRSVKKLGEERNESLIDKNPPS